MHQGACRCANCGEEATHVYGDDEGRIRIHVCSACYLLLSRVELWHLGDSASGERIDVSSAVLEHRT
jgi:hypothetical protein